jgi:hypothetical protein
MSQRVRRNVGSRRFFSWPRFVLGVAMVGAVALSTSGPAIAAPAAVGWLRFGHFASGTGGVDVYLDGGVASKNVGFEQVTAYARVAVGSHTLAARPAGSPLGTAAAVTATVVVVDGSATTVAAVAGPSGLNAQVYRDDLGAPPSGQAKLRIIPTIAGQASVDVFAAPSPTPTQPPTVSDVNVGLSLVGADKPPLFGGAAFGVATPYTAVPAGVYDVEVRTAASTQVLLTGHNWPVLAGTVASIVVLTGPSGPTLEVLRDAAGATATPSGGLATGAGGMADRPGGRPLWPLVAGLGTLVLTLMAVIARRSIAGRRPWIPSGRA